MYYAWDWQALAERRKQIEIIWLKLIQYYLILNYVWYNNGSKYGPGLDFSGWKTLHIKKMKACRLLG